MMTLKPDPKTLEVPLANDDFVVFLCLKYGVFPQINVEGCEIRQKKFTKFATLPRCFVFFCADTN